jgi:hypothetical protein
MMLSKCSKRGNAPLDEQMSFEHCEDGLEAADAAWKDDGRIDVSELEKVIGSALSKQLLRAAEEAEGRR